MFTFTPHWQTTYPGACAGLLVMRDAENPAGHPELASRKAALEAQLRADFEGKPLTNQYLDSYTQYYKGFKKTYHVKLQLKSIVEQGKSIPDAQALVQAMFMAEMKNFLLTAGHDLDSLQLPLVLDAARGEETYTLLRGTPQQLKAGDMFIRDAQGILSSIIYGPDQRTPIRPESRNVVYTVYAPQSIPREAVFNHLQDIAGFVQLAAPQASIDLLQVFP